MLSDTEHLTARPHPQQDLRRLLNARDSKSLATLITGSQLEYHESRGLKYRASSIGKAKPGSRPQLPEVSLLDISGMNGEKFSGVKYIHYEKELRQTRDWAVVLG